MTLKYADRVFETSTTTGTGTINLSGAVTSYQSFIDGVGTGANVPYCIKDGLNWEVGIGTVTAGTPDTLSRDFIIDSSNSGNAVNWGAGQRDVFLVASNILQFLRDENLNNTNEIAVSSSGTGSAHIATPFVTPIAFSDRMIVRWRAPATNPDGNGITLDWGGLGAKPYVNNDATDFETGVIQAGSIQEAVYNLAQDRFERTSPIYPATPPADMVSYDNTTSGLAANDVQDAIDEVAGRTNAATTSQSGIVELATDAEAQAGTDPNRAVTPDNLGATVIGIGQTWQNMTASRSSGTTYTNTTGRPIMVLIDYYTSNNEGSYTIGGITVDTVASQTFRQQNTISFIVPDGNTYSFTLSGFPSTHDRWLELR